MKIVDAFIFYNEIELLKARLYELHSVVDYFVIVEGVCTFTGIDKPLYYAENKELFAEYNDKIIHVIVDDFPKTGNPWDNEYHQRRCINQGLEKIGFENEDIIMITDVDEIPNYEFVANLKNGKITIGPTDIYSIEMKLFYYSINWTTERKWHYSKLVSYAKFKTMNDPQKIRLAEFVILHDAGWHISYFGDSSFIINKLESFSEQQDNTAKNKNSSFLNDCIERGVLHFSGEKLKINSAIDDVPKYFKLGK
jgi:beta-1,4-mannosyl-glycoprotein beta-1,4-N-acetylglucosaminyltransferase